MRAARSAFCAFSFRVYILTRAEATMPYFHLDKDKIVLDICRETVESRSSESAREKTAVYSMN